MTSRQRIVTGSCIAMVLVVAHAGAADARPPFQFPWRITDSFRVTSGSTYGCGTHTQMSGDEWDYYAIDFALGLGEKVAPLADGVVVQKTASGAWGNGVVVDHGGYLSRYAHFRKASSISVGERVRADQVVGESGDSGNTTGVHLHFQTGIGSNPNSATALKPEPMVGRDSGGAYVAQSGFGQWGCGSGSSPYWYSARPLTDVFRFPSFAGGASSFAFADSSGGWSTKATTSFFLQEFHPGFFDDDHKEDLYVYERISGNWSLYQGNGTQGLTLQASGSGTPGRDVLTGDFNADGLTDLYLSTKATGDWAVRRSNGSWGWTTTSGSGSANREVISGSFNADMRTDLYLWNKVSGDWATRLADGAGDWSVPASGTGTANREVVSGYFGSDRLSDLYLWTKGSGAWATRFADGAGDWTVPASGTGTADRDVVVGFFGSDSLSDLYLYTPSDGSWAVRFANGTGDWTVPGSGAGTANRTVVAGYYNKDRLTDLLLYSASDGSWAVRMTDGSGGWNPVTSGSWSPDYRNHAGHFDSL